LGCAFRGRLACLQKNTIGRIGIILLGLFALMALASFIPPWVDPMYHPMTGVDPHISHSTGPSLRHWLGTDFIGRDIFSQLLAGARIAFMVGISSALISILLGTTIGMVAGYAGKTTDVVLMRLADMIMVMPTLLVVLILAALFGQLNIWVIVLMIALFRWPGVARVIRSQTLSLRHRPFVEAARVAGASHLRILFRHILPHVMPLALLLHDLPGHLGHHHRGGPGISGFRGSGHGQLGDDAPVGLEDGAHVPGAILAPAAGHLYLLDHHGFLHDRSGYGRRSGPAAAQ
jgi:ABC-type dipeptide/oligopeptide/nickel transport system permease subunit